MDTEAFVNKVTATAAAIASTPKVLFIYLFFFLRHPDQQDNEKRFDEGSVLSTKRTPAEPRCDGGASITAD